MLNRRRAVMMLAASSFSDFALPATAPSEDQILTLDCTGLLARIRNGSLRAEHVCEVFLRQYERQRSLNVITSINQSNVLARARDIDLARDKGTPLPALAGLPIVIKDNIDTVGLPTSAGTAALKQNYPRRNAPVVARLIQQGAIVMGKGNMPEYGLDLTSNPTFGVVHNPYNPAMIAGGTSAGPAAAIAARIVPAALGTDTGGSVRIPAAFCGVVGFRPSIYPRNLYSLQGVVPFSLDLDTIGPMGRSVADVALLHAMIVGQPLVRPGTLKNTRIGVPKLAYWDDLDPEVNLVAKTALSRLRDHGAELVEIDLRAIKDAAWQLFFKLGSTMLEGLAEFLRTEVPSVPLGNLIEQTARCNSLRAAVKEQGATDPNPGLLDARGIRRNSIRAAYRASFQKQGIQAVVFPTVGCPPPQINAEACSFKGTVELNERTVKETLTIMRNTAPTAVFGAPALNVPAGLTSHGLPVGLEFDGLPGKDSAVLALAMAAEAAIGRVRAPSDRTPRITESS
jgi:Asp-tRNA(Asn)/Glu-tRNA(Gln) amidotransferase A subunit family amidase